MRNFSLKSMLADADVTIFPGRDEVPTQPHRPAPVAPVPKLPAYVSYEMLVAKEIFAELQTLDQSGRDRIMHMVSDLLRLYAPVEAESEEDTDE